METLLSGEWTSNDFIEVRAIDSCKTRISNSNKRTEHTITVQQKSPSVMKITIDNDSHSVSYALELLPRDMLTPLYKQASLMWLKLLFGRALKGDLKMSLYYITFDELRVNSVFIPKDFKPSRSVNEDDAAAVLFEVQYEIEGRIVNISIQVPKIIDEGWTEGCAPVELEMWNEPSDLFQKNQKMQDMISNLQQENQLAFRQFQKSQQELISLKSDLN